MKIVMSVGVSLLLSMTVACAAETSPQSDEQGKQSSSVTGDGKPAPSPSPTPAPAPACTPIAGPSGGVGLANPASTYCKALGYALDGSDCTFADGTRCEEWAFYRGECGQAHSFCNLHGGSVANKTEDMGGRTASDYERTLTSGKHRQKKPIAQN